MTVGNRFLFTRDTETRAADATICFPFLRGFPIWPKTRWPASSRCSLIQIPNHTSGRANPARRILARHVGGLTSKGGQNFSLVFTSHQKKCVKPLIQYNGS